MSQALDLEVADQVAAHKALAEGCNTLAFVFAVPDSEEQNLLLHEREVIPSNQ